MIKKIAKPVNYKDFKLKEKMKIGFFGDSFCSTCDPSTGTDKTYPETYIKKIKNHYNADIVNLGINGSSIFDVILLQIKPFIENNNYPDVCVFVWTNYYRLFHREQRSINLPSAKIKSLGGNPVWDSAIHYFKHLYDPELHEFQHRSALQYFDLNILSKFPKTTKIIHFWSFEKVYDWLNGVVVPNNLFDLAVEGRQINDVRYERVALNHFDTEYKNNVVFKILKNAIENYE
jgi:hypothetical protein